MTKYRITKETTHSGISSYVISATQFKGHNYHEIGRETNLTAAKNVIASIKAAQIASSEVVHEE